MYLQGITTRLDQLAILGKAVDHEDQIDLILEGLHEDYKPVIDQVEGRDAPPSITELHERLLNHEAKLQLTGDAILLQSPVTVNVAQNHPNSNYRHPSKQRTNNNNTQWSSQSHQPQWNSSSQGSCSDSRGPRPYLGHCQICGTQGHSAKRCSQLQTYQRLSNNQASSLSGTRVPTTSLLHFKTPPTGSWTVAPLITLLLISPTSLCTSHTRVTTM